MFSNFRIETLKAVSVKDSDSQNWIDNAKYSFIDITISQTEQVTIVKFLHSHVDRRSSLCSRLLIFESMSVMISFQLTNSQIWVDDAKHPFNWHCDFSKKQNVRLSIHALKLLRSRTLKFESITAMSVHSISQIWTDDAKDNLSIAIRIFQIWRENDNHFIHSNFDRSFNALEWESHIHNFSILLHLNVFVLKIQSELLKSDSETVKSNSILLNVYTFQFCCFEIKFIVMKRSMTESC